MQTLNLSAYGVSEMTHQEMRETDGGWTWKRDIILLAWGIALAPLFDGSAAESFMKGWEAASK